MQTVQVKILKPKAKTLLAELANLKLIKIAEEKPLFKLSKEQKRSIAISRREVKNGQFDTHKTVMSDLKKWLKNK